MGIKSEEEVKVANHQTLKHVVCPELTQWIQCNHKSPKM